MSLIEKIRDRQGLLMVMIGIGMLGFLVPYDAVMAMFGGGQNPEVGEVAGISITVMEYQNEVQNRRRLGFSGETLADEVWKDLTEGAVLSEGIAALGLTVTDDEYQELLFGTGKSDYLNRAFFSNAQNKQYWQQNFSAMLSTPEGRASFMEYKNLISDKRIREKYDALLTAGVYTNSLEGKYDHMAANKKVDFDYVLVTYASLDDASVDVSDSDVRSYFSAHKNDAEFQQKAGRDVTFARISVKATAQDAAKINEALTATKNAWSTATNDSAFFAEQGLNYNERSLARAETETNASEASFFEAQEGDLVGPYRIGNMYRLAKVAGFTSRPDSASCRHILLMPDTQGDEAELAELKTRADSLLRAIRRGANFEDLAARFSDDPGSKDKGGFYDFFPRGRMVAPFENFCFDNAPGSTGVVETQYGYHIIKVEGQTEPVERVSVAIIEQAVEPSSETVRNAYQSASEFAIGVTDRESFMAKAGEQGFPTNVATDIARNAKTIAGLRTAGELVSWAWSAEERDISNPILADNTYVVAFLDRVKQAGEPRFEHVEEAMRAGAIQEAKAEKLVASMGGSDLASIAADQGVDVRNSGKVALKFPTIRGAGAKAEPLVVGTAAGSEIGAVVGPIVGENGVWVISTKSVSEAPAKDDFLSEQTSLLARARGAFPQRILNSMLEEEELQDMRN